MKTQILDFTEDNGLVLCSKGSAAQNNYERLYISEVKKLNAYAVFFRRFFKNKEDIAAYKSEPVVCIFQEADVPVNSPRHKEIHAALWSESKIDVYIISGKTRLDIYNVRKPAERIRENELSVEKLKFPLDAVKVLDKKRSAAHLFGTGTFWEQIENQNQINLDKSPYVHLINYLMKVRKGFNERSKELELETIDKILVLSILVKFLEEKKDLGQSTLDEIFSKNQINSFVEAVENGKFLNVLGDLSTEFNGRVFDQFTPLEKEQIEKIDMSLLAQFLRAESDLNTQQLFLWKQYSFQHLPAEVISAIYENFIQEEAEEDGKGREKGVVYTPIHLVNFMVDEVMPLGNPPASFIENGTYKILDPTCGSGVFLVAAYKRLLQWWAIAKSEENGEIQYPDAWTAQKILEDNIFGVDVKKTAVRVTIFGLTTALLDYLTPKEVWGKLKFKDLSTKNIVEVKPPTGFFQWALDAKNEGRHFSLVIGNPPFNPEKNVSKVKVLDPKILDSLELKHTRIPRKNFALHFFEASMLLADRICMIIPSNVILYDKSNEAKAYRESLFTNYSVSDIYDFTHLRESLFVKKGSGKKVGRTPVVTLFAENRPSEFQPINHTVVKRTISVEQKVRFEIDEYDRHLVKWDWAVDPKKQFVWKTNLLGGGRLFHLIYRLSMLLSFKEYIKNNGWDYSVGYKLEGSNKKKSVAYLQGREIINTSTFDENENFSTYTEENSDFAEPRIESIYSPPHLIYKVNLGLKHIPIHLSDKYLGFKDKLVGIHAPQGERYKLLEIYDRFKNREYSKLMRLWVLSTSSETLINLETACKKEDIDSVPYPINLNKVALSHEESIIQKDVLDYFIHLGKQITKKSGGAILHHPVREKQLQEYGEVLCSELNDIYAKDGNRWQSGKVYRMPSYTVYQIGFGVDGKLKQEFVDDQLDDSIESLIKNDAANRGAAYKRIVRLYDHVGGFDCVYFIKPNALRYWLKSIALRDADETFLDFRDGGY
ncbi:N-6 DNA methylase [Algoriphagus ratkowskyi]|uniref:site-specific DNA-methyltransferase (adenine-specific) n=1 Tax=Algoriphagus ratkowskyi TaxID=57028 RepID=A0A2W7RWQ1_9BACT|nr:N-6 DNA methylase [Algoriphagus ratkowskyi]PZX59627.1 N-6 DNA methylase [Algoriphagus ratkowskyi]TXD78651.1 N-6 DNA methylase [Algoriphagus ratkowskyi]